MLRVITFSSFDKITLDVPHKRYFDICWLAIMAQGDPRNGSGARGRTQIKQARRIKAEFHALGDRLPGSPEGPDGRDGITLGASGGKVALAEDDYRKLIEWIEAVPWKGGNLDDVDECFDFLDAAPQVKSKDVKEALDAAPDAPALSTD